MLNLIHFEPKIANYHHFYGFPDKTQRLVTLAFEHVQWQRTDEICLGNSLTLEWQFFATYIKTCGK